MNRSPLPLFLGALLAGTLLASPVFAQMPGTSSTTANTLYGSVGPTQPTTDTLPLSLTNAIQRGLQHNLQLALAKQNQQAVAGERLEAINYLLPTVNWEAQRSRNQINLAAEGFRPGVLTQFPPGFLTPAQIAGFQPLVTVDIVSAQANLQQTLFDLKSLELYRAAQQEILAVSNIFLFAQQDVVQSVATAYLQVLSDEANLSNAQSLLATNAEILRQARLEHEAGIAARLDELRAQVQYQQQEQRVIQQQDVLEKAKVALNRRIGLPADQPIQLTDETPFATLQPMPLDEALQMAYTNRQDYKQLQAKLRSAQFQRDAAKYERLPTLSFGGDYGIVGTVGGVYHGAFQAAGALNISLSRLAKFRGDREIADALIASTTAQMANLKGEIETQIRENLLDLNADEQLVQVARSNVDLAHASLNDAQDRFSNGVSDDLPVLQAQSSLAAAQAQLVQSLYQYNSVKLSLARNLGIIDREYSVYLGTKSQVSRLQSSLQQQAPFRLNPASD